MSEQNATHRFSADIERTVMVRAPRGFTNDVLWPEFTELHHTLQDYLQEVTLRIIREEIHADASEAPEVSTTLTRLLGAHAMHEIDSAKAAPGRHVVVRRDTMRQTKKGP